jgi:hypothetical protein
VLDRILHDLWKLFGILLQEFDKRLLIS